MSKTKITDDQLVNIAHLWHQIVKKPFGYTITSDSDTPFPEFIREMQRTLGLNSSLKSRYVSLT